MSELPAEGGTQDQLQNPEQVALLDAIDDLRSEGLGHHGISLPQLIVCGDQSSGKSSLLEALTRLRFPTGPGCCTIFATEVILRRNTNVEMTVEIVPSAECRSPEERNTLARYKRTYSTRKDFDFQLLHTEVKLLLGIGGVGNCPRKGSSSRTFCKSDIRVPICPPSPLSTHQFGGGDGVKKVVDLVTSYIENERSTILAVVAAANNAENSQIFGYLARFDPPRLRTLGIITKPDRTAKGSTIEKSFVRLARNEEHPMKYHWHTVRNRDWEEKDQSDTERDETELQFFNNGPWASIPHQHVGVAALRAKLARVLLEHISVELHSLVLAVRGAADATESRLKALGNTRETTREQRAYLAVHAERFQALTDDALRGIYSNRFFSLETPDEQAPTRLRTAIQNLNIAFAHVMYQKGHTWDIVPVQTGNNNAANRNVASHPSTCQYGVEFEDAQCMTRTECLENHIGEYVRQSRPSGLPSLVNPWVIGDVLRHQSQSWSKIAKHHLQGVYHAIKVYINEALGSLIDPRTRNLLMLKQIQPELERRWSNVEAKLEELLTPYTDMDPITYDPGFLKDLEEMRTSRYRAKMEGHPNDGQYPFTFREVIRVVLLPIPVSAC